MNKKILEHPLNGRNPFALGLLAGNTTPMFGMGSNLPFIGVLFAVLMLVTYVPAVPLSLVELFYR